MNLFKTHECYFCGNIATFLVKKWTDSGNHYKWYECDRCKPNGDAMIEDFDTYVRIGLV